LDLTECAELTRTPEVHAAKSGFGTRIVTKSRNGLLSKRWCDSLNLRLIMAIPDWTRTSRRTRLRLLFHGLTLAFWFCFLVNVTLAQKMPESVQGPSVSSKFLEGSPADYAGTERCRSCHKPEFSEYEKTAHAKASVPSKSYISGCEVCHGPAKAHADAIEAAEGDEGQDSDGARRASYLLF
jgi:hypothetical protein